MRKALLCLFLLLIAALLIIAAQGTIGTSEQPAAAQSAQTASYTIGYSVVGKPSISANLINRVLCSASSPACGTGAALYADGIHYGIDPVYALAFFEHESDFGTTGVAGVTHSLGNIRCTPGYACIGGFRAYATWQAGYVDWYRLILNLYIKQWHLTTVEQIIPIYAPARDGNDPQAYTAAVENAVNQWRKAEA